MPATTVSRGTTTLLLVVVVLLPSVSALALGATPQRNLYLGIDLSTQSATAVVLDPGLAVVESRFVNFDEELPAYGTSAGMTVGEGGVVTSSTRMWLEAMDLLMGKVQETGLLPRVAAISCSGQQHGSVYWTADGEASLKTPAAGAAGFADLLPDGAFASEASPIWADSSTGAQCDALERALGGPAAVAELTGSRAYARFTGNQFAAFAERTPALWEQTSRVSLVSSFAASLFLGAVAPIDYSDGSGMNLMDISSRSWAPTVLSSAAMPAGLGAKLAAPDFSAEPAPSHAVLGPVSAFVAQRWGFDAECAVVASSGDNCCAVAGLGLSREGDLALSMGTSDTLLGVGAAATATPALDGHVLAHPTSPDQVMLMLCYKNGGAVRERLRDEIVGPSWDKFDAALAASAPGNGGLLGLTLDLPEITPEIDRVGSWHVDAQGAPVAAAALTAEQRVRAAIEGRFLSMRSHGKKLGLSSASRVLATGGGSKSSQILQVAADVFNAPVLVADTPDAAAVGAARRAAHALHVSAEHGGAVDAAPYESFLVDCGVDNDATLEVAAKPRPDAGDVYPDALVTRYEGFEAVVRARELD